MGCDIVLFHAPAFYSVATTHIIPKEPVGMEGLTVHVITNGDPIRMAATTATFNTYKLAYTFHHFEKHPTDGRLGCYLSHIALFNYAKKNNMEYIAIAEDNLKPTAITLDPRVNKEIQTYLATPSWNILLMGGFTLPFDRYSKSGYSYIYNTPQIHGTSFYIIHRQLYEKVLDHFNPKCDEIIDMHINRIGGSSHVLYPLLFHRDNSISTTLRYLWDPTLNTIVSYILNILRDSHVIRLMEDLAYYWIYFYLTVCICILFIVLRLFDSKGMPVSASNETTPGRS